MWIAVPLFIQTCVIFALGYVVSKEIGITYEDTAPTAMIGASNHCKIAIATPPYDWEYFQELPLLPWWEH
ncbi:MAG: hypothetical protein ACOCPU_02690 [Methanohalophilus sp.]